MKTHGDRMWVSHLLKWFVLSLMLYEYRNILLAVLLIGSGELCQPFCGSLNISFWIGLTASMKLGSIFQKFPMMWSNQSKSLNYGYVETKLNAIIIARNMITGTNC